MSTEKKWVKYKTRNGVCKMQLSSPMTIYTAADLYNELQPKIKEIIYKSHAIELDLTQVDEMDTAGVQILMLIKRDMDRAGCAMRVRELSGAVEDIFGLYRLRKSCFPEGVAV